MGKIRKPHSVMLFVGMLCAETSLFDELSQILQNAFGPLAHQSRDLSWNYTDYYIEELGKKLFRRFLFFENLIQPDRIAAIKVETNRLEERYGRSEKGKLIRRINLDPGYLDIPKVVLATTKDYSHRIYLGEGIYAEVTLPFVRGRFRPLDHTYPDYRADATLEIFERMRSVLFHRSDR